MSTMPCPLPRRRARRRLPALPWAALLLLALTAATAPAATLPPPQHGGTVTESAARVFETLVARDGLHVWLYTDESAPAMVGRAGGTASLTLPDGATREVTLAVRAPQPEAPGLYFCPMHAEVVQKSPGKCEPCGGMILFQQDELFGAIDLKGVDATAVTAQVRLTGLKGQPKEATFSPAFPRPAGKAASDAKGK